MQYNKLRNVIKEILNESMLSDDQDKKLYEDYEELLKSMSSGDLEKEFERLDAISKIRFKVPKSEFKTHANRAKKLVKKYMKKS